MKRGKSDGGGYLVSSWRVPDALELAVVWIVPDVQGQGPTTAVEFASVPHAHRLVARHAHACVRINHRDTVHS